jgi:hypothetical protein
LWFQTLFRGWKAPVDAGALGTLPLIAGPPLAGDGCPAACIAVGTAACSAGALDL